MTSKTLKELGILGALLVILAAVLYRQLAGPASTPPAPSNSTAAARTKRPPPSEGTVTDVKLALLDAGPDTFAPPKRNPFRFKPKPVPVVRQVAPPPVYVPPPVRPAPPPEPGIEKFIRYVGYIVSQAGVPLAALQYTPPDGPAVRMVGPEGFIIEGRYRLLKVEPDTIEVVELTGQGRRARISLSRS